MARFFVYSSMMEARNKFFFYVGKVQWITKGCSSVPLSLPFSLSLLPSLSPSFKLKETFWTYSSCGLIHRARLHGAKELSLGKGSSSWRVLRFSLCVECWFSWHPLAFVECLVNSWGHQKKWELMPVLLELAILVSFVQGDKYINWYLQYILKVLR